MSNAIELNGLGDVLAQIKKVSDLGAVNAALTEAAVYLKGKIDEYPPSKSRPGRISLRTRRPMGWYKRGTGWMSPIVRNGVAVRYVNYRATSETLGRKWTIASQGPLTVVVGNNVSYGPYVQSAVKVGGAGPQSRLMRAYGWKTVEDVVKQEESAVVKQIEARLTKQFGG